jgi:hypothetical protein
MHGGREVCLELEGVTQAGEDLVVLEAAHWQVVHVPCRARRAGNTRTLHRRDLRAHGHTLRRRARGGRAICGGRERRGWLGVLLRGMRRGWGGEGVVRSTEGCFPGVGSEREG